MKPQNRPFKYFRDPNARLSTALDTLEKFSTQNAQEPVPHIYQHPKDQTLFKKIIRFTKCCLAETIFGTVRKKNELEREKVEEKVLKAIDDVKRYHPLISKNISPEEKKLTKRATEAIRSFNQIVESTQEPSADWRNRLLRFLIKRTRLSFGTTQKIELSFPGKLALDKVATFVEKRDFASALTERETDAFRMKAISLMQNHGIHFSSIKDILCSLQESPIYTTVSRDATKGSVAASSILSLEQTLSPFPGETIILRGAFRRDANAVASIIPILESFKLGLESIHTGFPYPSQHTGWSLADPLVPPAPHRSEKLSRFPVMLRKKKEVAEVLKKQGTLSVKAKEDLTLKRDAVEQNKKEFLHLHEKLCLEMLSSAPHNLVPKNSKKAIYQFFGWLQGQTSILEEVSKWYRELNQECLVKPFEALNQAWLAQTKELLSRDSDESKAAAQKILCSALDVAIDELSRKEKYPPIVADFLSCMGKVFGVAGQNIILQYFSEVIEFVPPQLSDFEKKIQSATYKQLETFFLGLEAPQSGTPFEAVKSHLLNDIRLFSHSGIPHPIVDELETYYIQRSA